jgi:hypothetical protein
MTPEDEERVTQLVKLIQSENDPAKVILLMEELNELLGDKEAQHAVLRAGKSATPQR